MELKGKSCLVIGLGKSGKSAANLIKRSGGSVTFYKDSPFSVDEIKRMKVDGFDYVDIEKRDKMILQGCVDLIVISPSISLQSEVVKIAEKRGIKILTEVELASCFLTATLVGITGTNGKTTTTSLVEKLISSDDKRCFAVGNIGVPLTSLVETLNEKDYIVEELSSFQLEKNEFVKPKISCILNISVDHMDRHKTMENYITAKKNIFKNQDENDFLVLNFDDEILKSQDIKSSAKVVYFSKSEKVNGAYLDGENICFGDGEFIVSKNTIRLFGAHNLENALAAITIAKLLKISNTAIAKGLSEFKGISHRLQFVKT
ncbi:MAG: UDP-N-acetylmuramoyl-L-alanine--D-glutamate ligase, partial [Clostridia bacterium]